MIRTSSLLIGAALFLGSASIASAQPAQGSVAFDNDSTFAYGPVAGAVNTERAAPQTTSPYAFDNDSTFYYGPVGGQAMASVPAPEPAAPPRAAPYAFDNDSMFYYGPVR